jgi:tetratricopeptide (TPR) repeat protein
VLTFLGISEFQCGDPAEALKVFESCNNQSRPVLRFNIGRCKEELALFSEAKRIYDALHREFPSFTEPLLRLSALALRDSRPKISNQEAKQALNTIIQEINKNHVEALIELGNVHARARQFSEAVKLMQQAQAQAQGGDGYLYATVALGNYSLQSAQAKSDDSERRRRIDRAQGFFFKALKDNHNCISAVNGIAICWLLNDHVSEAKDQLVIVKEYRPDLSSSYENLGLAYQKEQNFGAAFNLFEEANKKFFDKTDVNLLIHSFNAAKGDKKSDVCLQIAEEMCRLRPESALHWYMLASALHKTVLMQLKAVHDKAPRVAVVERWIKQLERCVRLFEFCKKELGEKSGFKGINEKIDSIQNHLLPKFRDTHLANAREFERKREEEYQKEREVLAVDTRADEDQMS